MTCPTCDDTGWKPIDDPSGVRRVVRCDCWRQRLVEDRLASANIPKRYRHCSFDNFLSYNESLKQAAEKARRVPDRFLSARAIEHAGKGIFFEGPPGVGKTHLAAAILKNIVGNFSVRGIFYDTRELLKLIRSTYSATIQTTEAEVLRPVMVADLLVLDDIGAEKTSEWVEETMNLIVNTRYNERRMTVFTSNHPDIPDETDPNSLLGRIGRRMRSRLHEMCEFVEMDGADYRERPDNAGPDDLVLMWRRKKSESQAAALPSPRGANRQARASLREPTRDGKADLKWPGGRAGS